MESREMDGGENPPYFYSGLSGMSMGVDFLHGNISLPKLARTDYGSRLFVTYPLVELYSFEFSYHCTKNKRLDTIFPSSFTPRSILSIFFFISCFLFMLLKFFITLITKR